MRKDRIKYLEKKKNKLSSQFQNEKDQFKKRELVLKKEITESQLKLLKHQVYKMKLD
jgi:hypothetical protein